MMIAATVLISRVITNRAMPAAISAEISLEPASRMWLAIMKVGEFPPDCKTWKFSVKMGVRMNDTATVSDNLWDELRRHWSDPQLIELVVLAGWYRTISYVINAAQIELEPWAAAPPT